MGALDVNKVVHEHQGWRLITCMWLHGGVFHLLANMLSLLVIGIRLEREFGFGMVYIPELLPAFTFRFFLRFVLSKILKTFIFIADSQ